MPIEYHKAFKEGFTKFKKNGKGPIVSKNREFTSKNKDRSKFTIEMSLSSIRVDKRWYSVTIIHDISERKIVEERLIQSHQILEEMVNNTVHALVKIIELRDPYTLGH